MREVLIIIHALVCIAILISGLMSGLKIISIALVGWLFCEHLQRYFIGAVYSPKKLSYSFVHSWQLTLCNEERFPIVFSAPIWLSQWVSLLRVVELDEQGRKAKRSFSLIIFPQKKTKESYRRMLVLLRFPQEIN